MNEGTASRQSLWKRIDERLGLEALRYRVPAYANTLAYTLGGITFFSFLIVGVTGVFLAQFYDPTPSNANASTLLISTSIPFGGFVRNLHYWAAQAMIVSLVLHVTRVLITAAYKRPREFNWLVGVGLLATTLALFFTGSVIKWDQEGFEALEHNVEVASLVGGLGGYFSSSFGTGVPLLTRLYWAHVSVLPLILFGLLALHVFYIRYFGIAPLPERLRPSRHDEGEGESSFLQHLKKIVEFGTVSLVVTTILAVFFPAPLGPVPIEGLEVTKPPWPFQWIMPIESNFGIQWLFPAALLPLFLLILLPFLDRGEERDPRKRLWFIIAYFVGLAVILALTILAVISPAGRHLGM